MVKIRLNNVEVLGELTSFEEGVDFIVFNFGKKIQFTIPKPPQSMTSTLNVLGLAGLKDGTIDLIRGMVVPGKKKK